MFKARKGFFSPPVAVLIVGVIALVMLFQSVRVAFAATTGDPPQSQVDTDYDPTAEGSQDVGSDDPTVTDPPINSDPVQTTEPSPAPTEPEETSVPEDHVGRYPSKPDASGIKIVSPSLDALLAPGANIEALLYPSGLKLPTKYMDLLMVAPTNSSSTIVGETANFLRTIAPNNTNEYTFAEYEAADIYLAMCRLYAQEKGESQTGDALKNLDVNTTVNWMNNVTNATIADYGRLVALITNYKSILEAYGSGASIGSHAQYRDLTSDHKSIYYSFGDLKAYGTLADGTASNDAALSTYTTNLYSTWSYLGVTQSITTNLLEYSYFYNEFAINGVNFNHGAPANSFSPTDPDATTSTPVSGGGGGGSTEVTTPDHGGSGGGDVVSGGTLPEWANPNQQGSGDTPVSSVGSSQGVDTSILPSGRQNAMDIASKVALGFVIIGIIVVWVIHTHRKGQDPLSKWK